jgi:hypothetical protein
MHLTQWELQPEQVKSFVVAHLPGMRLELQMDRVFGELIDA